jgi:hypothetical protein
VMSMLELAIHKMAAYETSGASDQDSHF